MKNSKKSINPKLTKKINVLHKTASENADIAISYAMDVGRLRIEMKSSLKHREFTKYVKDELDLSLKQCHQYIAATKDTKQLQSKNLVAKSYIKSYLKKAKKFIPLPGMIYMLPTDTGDDVKALVECSAKNPEFFFVTVYGDPTIGNKYITPRPIESIMVHENLEYFGLKFPHTKKWKSKKSRGVIQSEETLYGPLPAPTEDVKPLMAHRELDYENFEIDWEGPYRDLKMPKLLIELLRPRRVNYSAS